MMWNRVINQFDRLGKHRGITGYLFGAIMAMIGALLSAQGFMLLKAGGVATKAFYASVWGTIPAWASWTYASPFFQIWVGIELVIGLIILTLGMTLAFKSGKRV